VKIEIYQKSGEQFRINPGFDIQPRETLEIVIQSRQVEIYRRSSQQTGDLNGPRVLESSLGGASASEGLSWARITQSHENALPDLEVRAFEEVLYGNTISDFERYPKTPVVLRAWTIRASEVNGQQIYFLNASDRPTTVAFCTADKIQPDPCVTKDGLATRFLVKPNECLVLGVKKLPRKYFFVESSNPGRAILARLVPAKGTTKVFHSESSISFGEPSR
jgi:hypothetical protein